ncbi:hypothetical protein ABIE51_002512 [Lysobacter sp. OAE881]
MFSHALVLKLTWNFASRSSTSSGAVTGVVRIGRGGRVVDLAAPERRQQVHRLVGAEVPRAELGVLRQFPAAVEQRALAGIRDGAIQRVFHRIQVARGCRRLRGSGDDLFGEFEVLLDRLGFLGGDVGAARVAGHAAKRRVIAGQALDIGTDRNAGFRRRRGGRFLRERLKRRDGSKRQDGTAGKEKWSVRGFVPVGGHGGLAQGGNKGKTGRRNPVSHRNTGQP